MKIELDENNLRTTVSELRVAFKNLSPEDNFQGAWLWQGTIPSNTEKIIPNKGRSKIPTYFIVLSISGASDLVKGDTEWTTNTVSLKNTNATTDLSATVLFFK